MRTFVVLLVVATGLCSCPVVAQNSTTFSINGSAALETALAQTNHARGGTAFFYSSYFGDAPDGLGFCFSGQVCDGSAMTGATTLGLYPNDLPIAHSGGCLRGVCSAKGQGRGMSGTLNVIYTFSFVTPTTDQSIDITVPITLSGTASALGQNRGQTLWTVNITGDGSAELCGNVSNGILRFDLVKLTYNGSGSLSAAHPL